MDHADDDRPQHPINSRSSEPAIKTRGRNRILCVAVPDWLVAMRMVMHVIAMLVRMVMRSDRAVKDAIECAQIEQAEQDEHESNAKFQTEPDPFRNDQAEEDDPAANTQKSEAVADTPENSSERGFADFSLPADDGGDGNDVIGVGRMAHSKEESEEEDAKQRGHGEK